MENDIDHQPLFPTGDNTTDALMLLIMLECFPEYKEKFEQLKEGNSNERN